MKITDTEHGGMRFAISICIALIFVSAFAIFIPDIKMGGTSPSKFSAEAYIETESSPDIADNIGMGELLDYAPLFLSTKWNYVSDKFTSPTPYDGDSAPASNFKTMGMEILLSDIREAEKGEMENGKLGLLNSAMRSFFTSFGRSANNKVKILPQNGRFKLVDLSSGKVALKAELSSDFAAKLDTIAEFEVSISDDGWISTPYMRESSGNEKTDKEIVLRLTDRDLLKGVKSGNYKAIFVP